MLLVLGQPVWVNYLLGIPLNKQSIFFVIIGDYLKNINSIKLKNIPA